MNARAGSASAEMGGDLEPRSDVISLEVHPVGCEGGSIHFFVDGETSPDLPSLPIPTSDRTLHAEWHADGGRHFLRVEARDTNDRLLLLGNPIYFSYQSEKTHEGKEHHASCTIPGSARVQRVHSGCAA